MEWEDKSWYKSAKATFTVPVRILGWMQNAVYCVEASDNVNQVNGLTLPDTAPLKVNFQKETDLAYR